MRHRAGDEVVTRDGADGLVTGRVEGLADLVVAPGIAQVGQDRECLLVHGPHALHDLVGVRGGVLEGTLEVVENRQPADRHRRPLLLAGAGHVLGAPLAEVVQLSGGPAPGVLELGDPLLGLGGTLHGVLGGGRGFGVPWF